MAARRTSEPGKTVISLGQSLYSRHINHTVVPVKGICCEAKNYGAALGGRPNRGLADCEGEDTFAYARRSTVIHGQLIDVNLGHCLLLLQFLFEVFRTCLSRALVTMPCILFVHCVSKDDRARFLVNHLNTSGVI